jgi:hypothetical protein
MSARTAPMVVKVRRPIQETDSQGYRFLAATPFFVEACLAAAFFAPPDFSPDLLVVLAAVFRGPEA